MKKLFVQLLTFRKKSVFRKKIRKIISKKKNVSWKNLDNDLKIQHKKLFSKICSNVDYNWLYIYCNISGKNDYRFVPEDIYYYHIEPSLNNRIFAKALTDKNFYHRILPTKYLPSFYIKSINGVFYNFENIPVSLNDAKFILSQKKKFIIKPSVESGGGKGVKLIEYHNDSFWDIETNQKVYFENASLYFTENFICQENIQNHSFYRAFNASSLNTIRMLTYRSPVNEMVEVLHTVLRVGKSGKIVDNQAAGGYALGVDSNGVLSGTAIDKGGNKYDKVNGIKITSQKIYLFEDVREVACEVASQFYYARLLGLDLCVDNNGAIKLIEVNCVNNEINFFQLTNGPLFGNKTDEVVCYCANHKRTFTIDITF